MFLKMTQHLGLITGSLISTQYLKLRTGMDDHSYCRVITKKEFDKKNVLLHKKAISHDRQALQWPEEFWGHCLPFPLPDKKPARVLWGVVGGDRVRRACSEACSSLLPRCADPLRSAAIRLRCLRWDIWEGVNLPSTSSRCKRPSAHIKDTGQQDCFLHGNHGRRIWVWKI